MNFAELFIKYGMASFDKQIYFEAMHGDAIRKNKQRWELRLDTGELNITGAHAETWTYRVQLLGTQGTSENTWQWSWGSAMGFDAALLNEARALQKFGVEQGIHELMTAEQPLTRVVNGRVLSLIAVGVSRAACYFRAEYPDGALFALIKDARYKRSIMHPLERIARCVPLFAAEFALPDYRAAYMHYLEFYRVPFDTHTDAHGTHIIAREQRHSTDVIIGDNTPRALGAQFTETGKWKEIKIE